MRCAAARHEPEHDLRLAESHGLSGNDQIADPDQLRSSPQREAVDCRDDRFANLPKTLPASELRPCCHLGRCGASHCRDIRPGCEKSVPASQHDDMHRLVGIEPFQRCSQSYEQLGAERVAHLRPIESQQSNAAIACFPQFLQLLRSIPDQFSRQRFASCWDSVEFGEIRLCYSMPR